MYRHIIDWNKSWLCHRSFRIPNLFMNIFYIKVHRGTYGLQKYQNVRYRYTIIFQNFSLPVLVIFPSDIHQLRTNDRHRSVCFICSKLLVNYWRIPCSKFPFITLHNIFMFVINNYCSIFLRIKDCKYKFLRSIWIWIEKEWFSYEI